MAKPAQQERQERIGWIGLGRMGEPMAANLLQAGWPLRVYNRSPGKEGALVARGAIATASVAALARESDIVISMIQDDAALAQIALGSEGVLQAMRPGSVYIDMSTVSPRASAEVARQAQAASIGYLRAPVSGSTANATAGVLTIFASGPADVYERCLPLFQKMGRTQFYVGAEEQARFLKLAINIMAGVTAAILGEALVLGEKGGLEWSQMIDIINSSAVASPLIGYKAQALKRRDFTPMFTATQMAKDFDFALDVGKQTSTPLLVTAQVRQLWSAMEGSGRGEIDLFGLVELLEDLSGLSTRVPGDQPVSSGAG
jgi:3-hydroxyisobutyrate dehydrogenase-like beta-hydroxyacid dehydrogenase